MEIKKQPAAVTITFRPSDYWLRKTESYSDFTKSDADFLGEYCLTHRIDMSYKGKDDQEGAVALFLDESDANTFREAGFSELL